MQGDIRENSMKNRYTCAVIGAAVLSSAMPASSAAQTTAQTTTQAQNITVVGCLQTESDYRRAQDAGKGGLLSTGAGLDNEYILIQTEGAGGPGGYDARANVDCKSSTAFAGTSYELTGELERDLRNFVGRRVTVTGELKHADDYGRPGGFDPAVVSQDLRLNEINVVSFGEPPMTAQPSAAPAAAETQPAQAVQAQAVQTPSTGPAPRETSGTSGQTEQTGTVASGQTASRTELPRTASPLALYGLLGLLSLGGAAALRRIRR